MEGHLASGIESAGIRTQLREKIAICGTMGFFSTCDDCNLATVLHIQRLLKHLRASVDIILAKRVSGVFEAIL